MAIETEAGTAEHRLLLSLGTSAACNLATTTKTVPQMQGITSRWLLRMLPWLQVAGGTYRVNRRLSYAVGRGRVSFAWRTSRSPASAIRSRERPGRTDVHARAPGHSRGAGGAPPPLDGANVDERPDGGLPHGLG